MNKSMCLLWLALFSLPAIGAEADSDMERLLPLSLDDLMDVKVSISTKSQQQLSKAPSVVSVITAEDIKATGARDVMEVLNAVPGIYIKHNLFAFRPIITMRGAPGTHVLLMVNGTPIRDLVWSNGIFWKGLPVSAVERIEIIRGPGSALFGSDASAGVINIITKTASPIQHSTVGVSAGSYDTRAGWLQHGASWNGFDIGVTAELSSSGGHAPSISQAAQGTSGRANYAWDGQDLRFSASRDHLQMRASFMQHTNLATGLNGAGVMDPLNRSNDSQYNLALDYDNPAFARDWGLNLAARYRDLKYSSGNGFAAPTTTDPGAREFLDSAERQASLEVSGLYSGFSRHALRVGGGLASNDIYQVWQVDPTDPAYPIPKNSRRNAFLYLQDVWSLRQDWEVTVGLRHDAYNDFGRADMPRLALVWQSTERLGSKLMYGEAYRAPSYQELYYKTAANTPNPNLKPERSKTLELDFEYLAARDLKLNLNVYRFTRTDLIAADATAAHQFQNYGSLMARGTELEAHWQAAPSLRLSGNVSYRKEALTVFSDVNAPAKSAYLRLDWAFQPRWNWDLQANGYGARPLLAGDTRQPLGAFGIVDTTLRYQPDQHWEFAVSLRNLLNADARDYTSKALTNDLPLPGRNGYAELRYTF